MSALLQIPKVLGTLRQKQDEDHMCMSYYKSQYHSQKYFPSLLSVLWENWFWNMWVLKHTWSSGMQPSDIIIFQHFTIEETEACKKHGVTFSQVAAGGIWPQAPWLPRYISSLLREPCVDHQFKWYICPGIFLWNFLTNIHFLLGFASKFYWFFPRGK